MKPNGTKTYAKENPPLHIGGVFVLKGLPGNSFQTFAQKVKELRAAGINTPISIDPEAYEKHKIQAVPTVVSLQDNKNDKISGNIRMETVLRIFSEKGETKEFVQRWTN